MDISSATINIVALLMALTFHECAHVWTAWKLGDNKALTCGRVSLNPKNNIDIVGTILLPTMLIPVILGWANPIPLNPSKFRNSQKGLFLKSLSGPAANLLLALILLLVIKLFFMFGFCRTNFINFLHVAIMVNVFLAFFNLIPIHSLDGYNAFINFLSPNLVLKIRKLEPYGILILVTLFYFDT